MNKINVPLVSKFDYLLLYIHFFNENSLLLISQRSARKQHNGYLRNGLSTPFKVANSVSKTYFTTNIVLLQFTDGERFDEIFLKENKTYLYNNEK